MQYLNEQNRIRELLTRFYAQVELAGALIRTDVNKISEDVLIPIFEEVYEHENLENLNATQRANYPAIDLGDASAGVAYQVTATPTSKKVKSTLEKFVDHGMHEEYDRLIIYILSEKQQSYSGRGFDEIIQGRFAFDKDRDIRDYRDLYEDIGNLPLNRTRRIKEILESHFGDGKRRFIGSEKADADTETVHLGLMEVLFSDSLYVADIGFDKEKVIEHSKRGDGLKKLRWGFSERDVAREALYQNGKRFSKDWTCHDGQIVAFHNLRDRSLPLSKIVDLGTVTELAPAEYYDVNGDYERVFKGLLRNCLGQKLYHQGIDWQNEEHLYIFGEPDKGEMTTRRETWIGKKKDSRVVYEVTPKKDEPDEIWMCKHFAFGTRFRRFGEKWYLVVKPEWFFSYDGYHRHYNNGDKVDWLKRQENNKQVFTHARFVAYQLRHEKQADLSQGKAPEPYPFLSFGSLLSFEGAPPVPDKEWLATEAETEFGTTQPDPAPLFDQ